MRFQVDRDVLKVVLATALFAAVCWVAACIAGAKAACNNPPLFDLSGPTCTPASQDIECQCSECATWDPVADVDWYDVHRVDQDGTVHTVIGSPKIIYSYTDDDGVFHPKVVENWYCFAMDASTPIDGRRYVYTVRACASGWTPNCGAWSAVSVSYIGVPIRCYDQAAGGQISCPQL